MVLNWLYDGYCKPDEDTQRYKAKIAEIDSEIAELRIALQDGELLIA
jgi:phosphopentomutase